MSDDTRLTFMGHIRELRSCLLRSVIALLVAVIACFILVFYFKDSVFGILTRPALERAPGVQLVYTEVAGMMVTYIKVSLILGVVVTLPFIVHQAVMFVRPALTRRERNYVYVLLPSVFLMFIIGAAFAYFVLLPPALGFLLTFGNDIAQPMIRLDNYVSAITKLIFWIGICFEIPLVIFFLARIGVVKPEWLSRYRKVFYIVAFVLGAIITPTMDPINQSLVAVPIILLYEFGILLARLARRQRADSASA